MSVQDTPILRQTPLSAHCGCDQQDCIGEVVQIKTAFAREIYIRCDPASVCLPGSSPREQAQSFYSCLPRILDQADAEMANVVLERAFFGDLANDYDTFAEIRRDAYRRGGVADDRLPVTSYVQQPPCVPGQAFELQAYVVVPESAEAANVTTIPGTDSEPVAKLVEINGHRHFYVNGIADNRNGRPNGSFRQQSDAMFRSAAELLHQHGTSFKNVLRTWCYLDDIDRDYDQFNASRNEFFQREDIQRLPASTGIRAGLYPPGTLCGFDLYALLNPDGAQIELMHTPTLNEAHEYGSAFSRGLKLSLPEKTVLFISGTASVDESGATAHVGDIGRQIERMFLNVEELLAPHGANFTDLAQVISYLKSPDDLTVFRDIATQWGLTDMPNSIVEAYVCRPDLLCEMEAIAVLPSSTVVPTA